MGKGVADPFVGTLQRAGVTTLALAAGLFVAAIGARASDKLNRLQPTAERAGPNTVRAQPAGKHFAPGTRPDVSPADAPEVNALYRLLIGPQPAHASDPRSWPRLRAMSSDDADREQQSPGI